jgi:hypothetical protein
MDWKSVLGSVAPVAASLLGGPIAGLAVDALGSALGITAPTIKTVKEALTNGNLSGDQIAALKQAEIALNIRLKELDIDLEKVAAADRDSARNMAIQTKDWTPRILAYAITLGFFGILTAIAFHGIIAEAKDVVNIMVGALGTAWAGCISYYFGSSSGSATKTDIIAKSEAIK